MIFFSVLRFYKIELDHQDLKKDLVINLVTSLVMKERTYTLIMNSILLGNIERIKKIQTNINNFKYKISLDKLGISKYF